ncbi:hypothetical protein N2152v2_005890 [Parachlorella kessleri]
MQLHREHLAPQPTEVVDLTADHEPQPERRPQQQQQLKPAALPGTPRNNATPALGPPQPVLPERLGYTPSILRTELRQQYESRPHEAEAPLSLQQLEVAAEIRTEEHERTKSEWFAARQNAEETTRAALKAAGSTSTALDRRKVEEREERLRQQLKQIEEELCNNALRRQASQGLQQPKQAPLREGEVDVILLSSDDDEVASEILEEESSAVASESEEVDHLAGLSVREGLPELPTEYYEMYTDALRSGNPMEQLVDHTRSNIELRRKDMACMAPLQWLNDEVMNLYMALLQERDMRARSKGTLPKCHFFSTFFLNKLYKDTGYNYNNVARWTLPRRLEKQGQLCNTILDCDRIIVPVHQGIHWVCAMVDVTNKALYYYDSLKGEDHTCLNNLAQYVADEYKSKRNQTVDTSTWDRVFPKNIPQQQNGCDCGVFTLLFADYAGRDAPMTFTQRDIDYFRVKIVNELLNLHID